MTKKKSFTEEQEQLAQFAKAMGNPTRVAVIQILLKEDYCYHGNMMNILPIAKSTLSQHLKELKNVGLIQSIETLPSVKYCIDKESWTKVIKLFGSLFKYQLPK